MLLNRLYKLDQSGTTVGRELQAGATTFAAMAYILAVNPAILSAAGMPQAALITVTALTAAVSTLLMGFLTNYPLALAPGMGINAYFAFTVCLGLGVSWQSALGLVFVNGCIFLALSVTGVREKIIAAIPHQLKLAITCGIGLFIAFIGLKNGGIVVSSPATFVTHGDFGTPAVLLCFGGILLTAVLIARRIPGAIILSILAVTLLGLFVSNGKGGTVTTMPGSLFSLPASPMPTMFQLNFDLLLHDFAKALPIILTLLLVDMFDNIGTLIGVTQRAGLLDKDGKLPKAGRALVADSIAAILSSLFGTSTVVSYIESASGVEAGGRTGLTGATTAVLFLFALFLTPVILAIPAAATAPALVIVGIFMFQSVAQLKLDDFAETAPAFLIIAGIPLSFSIAEGIGLGLIAYAVLRLATGRAKQTSPLTYVLALIFSLHLLRAIVARLF
ncbi:putative MFS transporter, AGZA family, xanthine/uracil permease [Opitutus sp. GAS368]|jgi:AGZA family xanthine/uracil permease-like MFS transporter|nr:NCS2 family permease [Opitutus sp. GAS368]SDS62967.1 putative MFS transporter, AGZA family, xanthine/uracil permease [Opitutus sp. GAS368]